MLTVCDSLPLQTNPNARVEVVQIAIQSAMYSGAARACIY